MKDFGWRLENLRDKSGFTKREVSLLLGFTANVYGSYEREDRRPALETIIKLADIYDVSLDYLIRGEEYQQNDVSISNQKKLQTVIDYFRNAGINDPYFLQLEKWRLLNKNDLREISNHFEWMVDKARTGNRD